MRCTIALDDASMMTTQEQEIADVKSSFLRHCGDLFEFKEHDVMRLDTMSRTDILVVDFGGLGVGYGGDASRYGHALMKLIDSRPSTLFCLWSKHTEHWYKSAIYDALLESEQDDAKEPVNPSNVVCFSYENDKFWDQVKAWIGITEDPVFTPELEAKIEEQTQISRGEELSPDTGEQQDYEDLADEAYGVEDDDEVEDDEIVEVSPKVEKARDCASEPFRTGISRADDGGLSYGDVIGELRIPIRVAHRPGQNCGGARFKFADCIVDVVDDQNTPEERVIAAFGGEMYGYYGVSFHEPFVAYMISPQDMWPILEKFHKEMLEKYPGWLTHDEDRRATYAAEQQLKGNTDD